MHFDIFIKAKIYWRRLSDTPQWIKLVASATSIFWNQQYVFASWFSNIYQRIICYFPKHFFKVSPLALLFSFKMSSKHVHHSICLSGKNILLAFEKSQRRKYVAAASRYRPKCWQPFWSKRTVYWITTSCNSRKSIKWGEYFELYAYGILSSIYHNFDRENHDAMTMSRFCKFKEAIGSLKNCDNTSWDKSSWDVGNNVPCRSRSSRQPACQDKIGILQKKKFFFQNSLFFILIVIFLSYMYMNI